MDITDAAMPTGIWVIIDRFTMTATIWRSYHHLITHAYWETTYVI